MAQAVVQFPGGAGALVRQHQFLFGDGRAAHLLQQLDIAVTLRPQFTQRLPQQHSQEQDDSRTHQVDHHHRGAAARRWPRRRQTNQPRTKVTTVRPPSARARIPGAGKADLGQQHQGQQTDHEVEQAQDAGGKHAPKPRTGHRAAPMTGVMVVLRKVATPGT